jgi:hypothetical protein
MIDWTKALTTRMGKPLRVVGEYYSNLGMRKVVAILDGKHEYTVEVDAITGRQNDTREFGADVLNSAPSPLVYAPAWIVIVDRKLKSGCAYVMSQPFATKAEAFDAGKCFDNTATFVLREVLLPEHFV